MSKSKDLLIKLGFKIGYICIYQTLMVLSKMRKDAEIPDQFFSLEIKGVGNPKELITTVRNVVLVGDGTSKPYCESIIKLCRTEIDSLRPLSYYVLGRQIQVQRIIMSAIRSLLRINVFDLKGMVDYQTNQGIYRISPPVVEKYFEPLENREVSVIVDGIHRVWLARELGLRKIGVIEISHIPRKFPLVPLPLNWGDVSIQETVPEVKRNYRFPDSRNPYFFYRDLSPLGSAGIRKAGSIS